MGGGSISDERGTLVKPNGFRRFGVDVNEEGIMDTYEAFVWEPQVKPSARNSQPEILNPKNRDCTPEL